MTTMIYHIILLRYNDKQLFAMIHEHLVMSGCFKTAETLKTEIDIQPLVDPGQFRYDNSVSGKIILFPLSRSLPPVYPRHSMISFHPSQLNRRLAAPASSRDGRGGLSRQPRQLAISNNSSSRSSTTTPSTNRVLSSSSLTPRQSNTASSINNSISSSTNPLQIRINRSSLPSSHTPGKNSISSHVTILFPV